MKVEKRINGTAFLLGERTVALARGLENCEDEFECLDEGIYLWKRTCKTPQDHMCLQLEAEHPLEWFMVPGLSYNGNDWGDRLDYVGNREKSSGEPWVWAWHRSTIAGATYAEGNGLSSAMYLPLDQHDGSCSVYAENDKTVHELLWPEQEGPTVYREKHRWIDGYAKTMEPRCEFKAYLVFAQASAGHTGWHKLVQHAWTTTYRPIKRWYSDEELWRLGIAYAKTLYTEEADGFCGFSIGLQWENDSWKKRSVQKYEIGWCGQNASLAVSLLAEAQKTGDQQAKEMGLNVLDAWARAKLKNGIPHTHYDDNMYTQGFSKTVDACNLGTAALQYFEAYDRAAALGVARDEYIELAKAICKFAMDKMQSNGCIGKSWIEKDFSPAIKDGTVGAFLTLALCEGAKRLKDSAMLDAAEKSYRYYMSELDNNGYTTAGALDIYCVDKESSIPLLKSGLMLHELTGSQEYLNMAQNAAWYLSTWQMTSTIPYPADSILGKMGFNTFGGTVVSTTHLSIDHFALCYMNDLRELAHRTGDLQWKQRADAIWLNGQQGVSDGTLDVEGHIRPVGSQDEGLQYTFWSELNAPTRWLVAWPTAFRLEQLRNRKN